MYFGWQTFEPALCIAEIVLKLRSSSGVLGLPVDMMVIHYLLHSN